MELQIVRREPAQPVTVWLGAKQRAKLERMRERTGLSASCIVRAALDALGDVIVVGSIDDLEGGKDG